MRPTDAAASMISVSGFRHQSATPPNTKAAETNPPAQSGGKAMLDKNGNGLGRSAQFGSSVCAATVGVRRSSSKGVISVQKRNRTLVRRPGATPGQMGRTMPKTAIKMALKGLKKEIFTEASYQADARTSAKVKVPGPNISERELATLGRSCILKKRKLGWPSEQPNNSGSARSLALFDPLRNYLPVSPNFFTACHCGAYPLS